MAKCAYFNLNPKGLRTSDCVIRAFAYFLYSVVAMQSQQTKTKNRYE